jgi:spermidine/putrescine transport system substrate-binding protein
MVIPAAAPNLDAAYAWLNFNLQPQVAADMAQRLYLAPPYEAVLKLLPADMLSNPKLFPPTEILARCEGIAPLPNDVSDLYDQYWTRITSA